MSVAVTRQRGDAASRPADVVRRAGSLAADPRAAIDELRAKIGDDMRAALTLMWISPEHDRDAVLAALSGAPFGPGPVIGCTTAGEISPEGYATGSIVVAAFPETHFSAAVRLSAPLESFALEDGAAIVTALRRELDAAGPPRAAEFALMMSDGLSMQEDLLVSSIGAALGNTPLIGGSAGDGLDFRRTFVLHDGAFHEDAALVALIRSDCPVRAFRFDHFSPTDRRMVVTRADPARRAVQEINAEPAALEYARMVGKDPNELTLFTFASNPVVVRVGGQHHVRSIQRSSEDDELVFYSAIDEGLVLTVAESHDIADHLEAALETLSEGGAPDVVIGHDCILRRLEVEQRQIGPRVSSILSRHKVVGFNTYGEQHNMLHVNQTFTGVAIYPPDERASRDGPKDGVLAPTRLNGDREEDGET